jgi:hypothetical protein
MEDIKRNYRIDNVELNWAKLDKPVSPFGTLQWELQVATTDKAKAKELSDNYFNVKEKDGVFTVALKKKAIKADGTENRPVQVVDGNLQAMDPTKIGNGSVGNVIVYQYSYDMRGQKGVGTSLQGVQVTDLKEYNPNTSGFEAVGGGDSQVDLEDAPVF